MNILLMNHFPLAGSGSGVYTSNIAHALIKQGHQVHIIMPENEQIEVLEQDGMTFHPVYFTREADNSDEAITGQLGRSIDDALPFNFPCFTTHPRSIQTFYDLSDAQLKAYENAFRAAIEDELEDFQPDVIHCGHIWVQPALAAEYDIPLVITAHGTDLMGFHHSERFRPYAARAAAAAQAMISISQENAQLVADAFPEEAHKSHLILNGYNSDIMYPEADTLPWVFDHFGIKGDYDRLVSFAGKFAYFKGIDILLRAAAEFLDDHTALVIAGDGELFDEMNELADSLGLSNAYFVRNQPQPILRKIYSAAEVSLMPSRKEPFGLVMIEALACGTPVIGSDDGGAVDVLTEQTGLLFQSENPEDLARQVKRVLDGEVSFNREHIAQVTKAEYAQDNIISRVVDLYQ